MFEAVKECLKNWLKTHERLYWYIVVGLAVIAFGVITALGCAKLEKANAAESVTVPWMTGDKQIDFSEYPYYCYFITEEPGTTNYLLHLSKEPFTVRVNDSYDALHYNSSGYWYRLKVYSDGTTSEREDAVGSAGLEISYNSNYGKFKNVRSNHDILNVVTGEVVFAADAFTTVAYSSSAPYALFDSFVHDNKIAQGDTKLKLFEDIYEDYTSASKWVYVGKIVNTATEDVSYRIQFDVTVELPNDSLILQMAESADVDLSWEHNVLNYTPDFVNAWYKYNGLDYSTYKFEIDVPVEVNERGEFEIAFTFPETEYLLMGDDDFRQRFMVYNGEGDSYWKSILLSYLHIDTVSIVVETERAGSVVYGNVHSVRFDRGYRHWFSATTVADKEFVTSDLLESMVNSDLQIAQREHLNELENRLDEMQNQIDDIYSVNDGFGGNLENTDLWTGFQNLAEGLSSLAPSIRALSVLTGAVFGFLPLQISGIISFTLFAVCIIAIIKAIRG